MNTITTLLAKNNLLTSLQKFIQCMATKSHVFELDEFSDKSDFLGKRNSFILSKPVNDIILGFN